MRDGGHPGPNHPPVCPGVMTITFQTAHHVKMTQQTLHTSD